MKKMKNEKKVTVKFDWLTASKNKKTRQKKKITPQVNTNNKKTENTIVISRTVLSVASGLKTA